jgi:hypothetical protein
MRNWIIGAAALLAVATPGVASAASGYAGVVYNNVDVNHGGNDDAWGAQGSVAFQGSSSIGFEVDASAIDSDAADTVSRLAGHVFTRNESYLFGGFAAVDHSDNDTAWSAGLEANKYFERWTLAGAVGYENDDDVNASAWGANLQGRFFATDNFRLDAHAGYARVDYDGPGNDNVTDLGVGGEYQFGSAPISLAAAYDHADLDHGDDANVWTVAVRYNWGGTLRDRDRTGASQADLVQLAGVL